MQKKDYMWFTSNLDSLYQKYGSVYLAIKNETVIGVYHSYAEGVHETQKTEPLGTFIVQKCGNDESVHTNYISSFAFC